jgi:hypothetical protein
MELPIQAYLLIGFFVAVIIAVSLGFAILKHRK